MIHNIRDNSRLKLWHFSDTHTCHEDLIIPDVDIAIFSGDESNHWDLALNTPEFERFIGWYAVLPIPVKIFVPGNHSSFAFHNEREARKMCKDAGIAYLNKDTLTIYDLKVYGDPITPRFGNWHFTTDRAKTVKHWELIPEDTNILITHGPPKGILDLSYNANLEFCGDSALGKRIEKLPDLKLHCFGHIHSSRYVNNTGVLERNGVFYSNASAVKDGEINKGIHFHGNTFKF